MSWRAAAAGFLLAAVPGPVPADRDAVLLSWTRPTAASMAAWSTARADRAAWAAYAFDWSTDDCTRAPERPFGFRFGPACRRHDFGYRNYRAAGTFAAHRKRLDEAFRADLRRECDGQPLIEQPPCNALAFTYFHTVRLTGVRSR
ncbi:phospholipase [Actinoplanes sp. NPDC023714]|uniref:phospholipase n=1 Tax=Actinoplanes sp. NPDC023714 TaxID=3154322 RepID=UPI00340439EE